MRSNFYFFFFLSPVMLHRQRKPRQTLRAYPRLKRSPISTAVVRLRISHSNNSKVASTAARAATSKATSNIHLLRIPTMPTIRTGSTAKVARRLMPRTISGALTTTTKDSLSGRVTVQSRRFAHGVWLFHNRGFGVYAE